MAKVNLPGLHGGISRIPLALRPPHQVSDAVNTVFRPNFGVRGPRWGTHLKATAVGVSLDNILGDITTSDGVQWVISYSDTTRQLTLNSINGEPLTQTTLPADPYMPVGTTAEDLVVLPLLDTCILLNKKSLPKLQSHVVAYGKTSTAFVYVPELHDDQVINLELTVELTKASGGLPAGTKFISNYQHTIVPADNLNAVVGLIGDYLLMSTCTRSETPGGNTAAARVSGGMRVNHNGYCYECVVSHTSTTNNTPGSGGGAIYWQVKGSAWPNLVSWSSGKVWLNEGGLKAAMPTVTLTNTSSLDVVVSSSQLGPANEAGDQYFVNTVPAYEQLPHQLPVKDIVIQLAKGYYIRQDPSTNAYVETVAPGHGAYLTPASMPHELRYEATSSPLWTLEARTDYQSLGRAVGDSDSAPTPPFVGKVITDVFYYRNRLCFLSGAYVCMSRTSRYFSWFPGTTYEVLDDDPIAVFPTSSTYEELWYAIPHNRHLMLFSARKQFVLHSGYDSMTPATVAVDEVASFQISKVRPAHLNESLVFIESSSSYGKLMNYVLHDTDIATTATSLVDHVPRLVPAGTTKIVHLSGPNLVLCFRRDSARVQVLHYVIEDGAIVHTAWTVWEFPNVVNWIAALDAYRLVLVLDGKRIVLMDTQEDIGAMHLDYMVREMDRPSGYTTANTLATVAFSTSSYHKLSLNTSTRTVAWSWPSGNQTVVTGVPIPWSVELSPLVLRDDSGLPRADIAGNVENLQVTWRGGSFKVVTGGKGIPTKTHHVVPEEYTDDEKYPGNSLKDFYPTRILAMYAMNRLQIKLESDLDSPHTTDISSFCYNLDTAIDFG